MKLIEKMSHGPEFTGTTDEPWITRDAITFLEKILTKDTVMIEYGCGTSTAWYAQRVKHLTSIEHDKGWYDRVYKYLQFKNIKNVDLRCIDIRNGYIEAIDNMGKFDIISVDGRRRSECIMHSCDHVNIGGYLLLDNAERNRYQDAIKNHLGKWKTFDFNNGIWLTSAFKRVK